MAFISLSKPSWHIIYPLHIIFVVSGINQAKVFLESEILKGFYLGISIGIMFSLN